MRGKIFNREDADRMIPLIRRIAVNVRARHRLLLRKQDEMKRIGSQADAAAARDRLSKVQKRLRDELKVYIGELEGLGCFLRDAELGIVECYGELKGEIVYFTWQPGHVRFSAWHNLDQSFVNRQPMPGLESKAAL